MRADGARCLVVAGGRGLGREIALGLGAAGAGVVVSYLGSQAPAAATHDDLVRLGVPAAAVRGDVRTPEGAASLIDEAARSLSGLDALVFAASGPFLPQAPEEIDATAWSASLEVVAGGFFFCATAAYRRFRGQGGGGVIVAVTDVLGAERPSAQFAAHGAAKAAEVSLVRSLAKAWAADGVRVCGVAPGPLALGDDLHPENSARAAARVPLGRPGDPGDIASAVRFCLENDSLTGVNLVVDGGLSLR